MYAVRCSRRVQHLLTDEHSLRVLDVAERHARGEATDSELDAAWDAARAEQTADFKALLAAHHAMPGESCALVEWRQGESNE